MTENPKNAPIPGVDFADEEVNLADLFVKIRAFASAVLKNWYWVLLLGILMGVWSYRSTSKIKRIYTGSVSFLIEDKKEEDNTGDYASLDVGIAEKKALKYNWDKIKQLSLSKRVVHGALFDTVMLDGKMDFLGNHLINIYELDDYWATFDTSLVGVRFTHDSISTFDYREKAALAGAYRKIALGEQHFCYTTYDEDSGIFKITTTTIHEGLTIAITKAVYHNLSDYYIEVETERQMEIFRLTSAATDSLRKALYASQIGLLKFEDTNMGLARKQYEAKKLILETEVQQFRVAFGESFSNLQSVEMALRNTIPFIHTLDLPIEPLKSFQPSPTSAAINGGIMGAILAIVFFISRKILSDIFEQVSDEIENVGKELEENESESEATLE